jgi:hypothetical protein
VSETICYSSVFFGKVRVLTYPQVHRVPELRSPKTEICKMGFLTPTRSSPATEVKERMERSNRQIAYAATAHNSKNQTCVNDLVFGFCVLL